MIGEYDIIKVCRNTSTKYEVWHRRLRPEAPSAIGTIYGTTYAVVDTDKSYSVAAEIARQKNRG